jgi:hypothetical protein
MAAIDPKPSKRRWDSHPRLARRVKKPAPLVDEAAARLLCASEKEYRETLFADFCRFARSYGAFVVSVPWQSPALVLVPLGDGETSPLEIALQQLPKFRVTKLPATTTRLSHGVFEAMRQIEVTLWRGS